MIGARTSAPQYGMPSIGEQHPGTEGAHHVLRAVREVDDVHQAKDDGEAERQQRIERAVDQAQQQLAEQRLRRYADQLEHGAAVLFSAEQWSEPALRRPGTLT